MPAPRKTRAAPTADSRSSGVSKVSRAPRVSHNCPILLYETRLPCVTQLVQDLHTIYLASPCLLICDPVLAAKRGTASHPSTRFCPVMSLTASCPDRFLCLLQAELEAMDVGDRMKRIEPFWKGLSRQERVQLMTVSVAEVKAEARRVAKKDAQAADGTVLQQPMLLCVA